MGLQSVRHIALYAVVVTPLLGARLQAELPALARPLASWRRPGLLAVTWVLAALTLVKMVGNAQGADRLQLGREPSALSYPVGAVEYLRTHDLPGNLFNAYYWGGYLAYQLYPHQRVFIDGRADVYGDALVEQYVAVARLQPGWREVLDEHNVRLILVEKDSPLATVLRDDPNWQEAYAGDVERLLVRRDS